MNRNLSNCEDSPKKIFSGLQRDSNPWPLVSAAVLSQVSYEDAYTGGWPANLLTAIVICIICIISFVFPQFTSFHSKFHSFHGFMNSINWPASSVWVFIAQLGEHCSANAEATGSNPVEAPKIFFSGVLLAIA